MSSVYSAVLLEQQLLNGTASVGVPALETWVVRDIELVQGSASTSGEAVVKSGTISFFYVKTVVSGAVHVQWEGRAVLAGGSNLVIETNTDFDVLISGYRLT